MASSASGVVSPRFKRQRVGAEERHVDVDVGERLDGQGSDRGTASRGAPGRRGRRRRCHASTASTAPEQRWCRRRGHGRWAAVRPAAMWSCPHRAAACRLQGTKRRACLAMARFCSACSVRRATFGSSRRRCPGRRRRARDAAAPAPRAGPGPCGCSRRSRRNAVPAGHFRRGSRMRAGAVPRRAVRLRTRSAPATSRIAQVVVRDRSHRRRARRASPHRAHLLRRRTRLPDGRSERPWRA